MNGPSEITLVILAGGKGMRLKELEPNRPKPMILVKGKPFLHWLVQHYVTLGFRKFILSTCHMAEIIENYEWSGFFPEATFSFERETTPLGTGGAVRAIFSKWQSLSGAWIINGDTLLPQPLPAFPDNLEALYTVLAPDQLFDATPNLVADGNFIVAEQANGHYFDAGALYMTRRAINRYKGKVPCSTHALLAPAMELKHVGYRLVPGTCYDIGTPERYKRFEKFLGGSI